jgi:flagella basal body P-ring formation protein FlgA
MMRIAVLVPYALAGLLVAPCLAGPSAHADALALPGSPASLVTERLDAALEARGLAGAHEIALDNPMMMLPPGIEADALAITRLSYDAQNGRVDAILAPPGGKPALHIGARVFALLRVVVPTREIEPGEVIAAGDLAPKMVRRDQATLDSLTEAAAFIGRTPLHPLRAEAPVRAQDLARPLVIRRGDLVTMTVETALMTLTTQGQALGDATEGAPIRIANTSSKRIIEGVAVGPGAVAIEAPPAP